MRHPASPGTLAGGLETQATRLRLLILLLEINENGFDAIRKEMVICIKGLKIGRRLKCVKKRGLIAAAGLR
jgi:hypothetical protein